MQKILRFLDSLTTRLQFTTLLMSVVGIYFSYSSYLKLRDQPQIGNMLIMDLELQIVIALMAQVIAWLMISRLVVKPVVTLIEIMRKLSNNEYNIEVPYASAPNQIGSFARKVKLFKENVIHTRQLERERVEMEEKARAQHKALMQSLSDNFDSNVNQIIQQFHNSAQTVKNNAESLSIIAREGTAQLKTLLQQSVQTSDNMESVSDAAEKLTHTIHQVNEQASAAASASKAAVAKAATADEIMRALSNKTSEISKVLSMITDIADQINLLSLNATIEAARAGEAGKGFAVVASEVKNLATQSAAATEEIAKFITHIADHTKMATESIKEIRDIIEKISAVSAEVTSAVMAQDNSTRHIAENIHNTAGLASESKRIADTVSAATQKIERSATEMLSTCTSLNQQSAGLDTEVDRFVATLRQA